MAENTTKHVLIVAGEASGDLHGSNLARAMMELNPRVHIRGVGGRKMEAAGVDILIPSSDMAVVGLTEVLARLSSIIKAHLKLRSQLKNSRPDLIILIDYPDFNINLARTAKHYGVPVLYYISPQVWAWRSGRVKKIAGRVDRMAVILPFEKDFYLKTGTNMDVEYVGHPLLDAVPHDLDRLKIKQELRIKDGNPILGILPGSRDEEIRNLLPIMIGAAESLLPRYNNLKCLLPVAPTISPDLIQSFVNKSSLEILVSSKDIYSTLSVCDLALVASGTATLETAIMEVPMVIAYRVSSISAWIGKIIIKVPYVGLVNIIAEEEVVPELLQDEVTPQGLADKAISILENEDRKREMIKKLRMIKTRLGSGGASERTAKIAMKMMESN